MGLNLNYTPNRLVDITTLTEDQWLSWRRKGIGGSDVAVALNSSPYRTARDLYYDKIGVVMSDDGPDRSITFQIGHLLEDVVAQIFAKKTGLSVYEDHWMYQHPFFPFLIADVDRFVTLPDGRKAILECKTAHYDMQFKWANGAVPRHYELQVRHYMSVMNIDVAFIACLFSNTQFCMNGETLASIIADAPIKMPPDEDAGHPGSVVASFTAQPTTDPPVFSQTATAPKSTQPTQQQVQPPVQQSHAPAPEPPKTLDEFLRVMTIEQAKAVKVDFGRFSGWSLGEIAMKSPGDLAWYVKNYSGHNLALKAGATKLLETVGQMAS